MVERYEKYSIFFGAWFVGFDGSGRAGSELEALDSGGADDSGGSIGVILSGACGYLGGQR